jgi:LacI family transcriptional regulator
MNKKPTQFDVASLAGVSQSTVSLVLNNPEVTSVPPETRQRVLDAIQSLGYAPNAAARTLRTRKTYTLACIIPSITNPFYPEFVSGVQSTADQQGYEVIVHNTFGRAEKEAQILQSVKNGRADGIVGVFFHTRAQHMLPEIEQGIAIVRLEVKKHHTGDWPIDNLYVDNTAAAYTATRYLIRHNCARVVMITGPGGPHQARREGYSKALSSHSPALPDWVIETNSYDVAGGYEGTQKALQDSAFQHCSIFAANDLMAMGAIKAIREAGLRIPEDVELVGFDDIPSAELVTPALTTIRQCQYKMGETAAAMVIQRLCGMAPQGGRNVEMPFELVIRESTR